MRTQDIFDHQVTTLVHLVQRLHKAAARAARLGERGVGRDAEEIAGVDAAGDNGAGVVLEKNDRVGRRGKWGRGSARMNTACTRALWKGHVVA